MMPLEVVYALRPGHAALEAMPTRVKHLEAHVHGQLLRKVQGVVQEGAEKAGLWQGGGSLGGGGYQPQWRGLFGAAIVQHLQSLNAELNSSAFSVCSLHVGTKRSLHSIAQQSVCIQSTISHDVMDKQVSIKYPI